MVKSQCSNVTLWDQLPPVTHALQDCALAACLKTGADRQVEWCIANQRPFSSPNNTITWVLRPTAGKHKPSVCVRCRTPRLEWLRPGKVHEHSCSLGQYCGSSRAWSSVDQEAHLGHGKLMWMHHCRHLHAQWYFFDVPPFTQHCFSKPGSGHIHFLMSGAGIRHKRLINRGQNKQEGRLQVKGKTCVTNEN